MTVALNHPAAYAPALWVEIGDMRSKLACLCLAQEKDQAHSCWESDVMQSSHNRGLLTWFWSERQLPDTFCCRITYNIQAKNSDSVGRFSPLIQCGHRRDYLIRFELISCVLHQYLDLLCVNMSGEQTLYPFTWSYTNPSALYCGLPPGWIWAVFRPGHN